MEEALFEEQLDAVRAAAPCLLLIDEIQNIAPSSVAAGSQAVQLALQLADAIQRLREWRVFVLGVCRDVGEVHPALLRSGRLHHMIGIRALTPSQRLRILRQQEGERGREKGEEMGDEREGKGVREIAFESGRAAEGEGEEGEEEEEAMLERELRRVAAAAHGLCAAQLVGICQQAALAAWRREALNEPMRRNLEVQQYPLLTSREESRASNEESRPSLLPSHEESRPSLIPSHEESHPCFLRSHEESRPSLLPSTEESHTSLPYFQEKAHTPLLPTSEEAPHSPPTSSEQSHPSLLPSSEKARHPSLPTASSVLFSPLLPSSEEWVAALEGVAEVSMSAMHLSTAAARPVVHRTEEEGIRRVALPAARVT
ncbi:MAG: hypothetical protein SGPRY_002141, partial [Prymnesium sp.]